MRAAIYTRISNDREGRELGVTRQEEDLRKLAEQRGYTVVGHYRDNDIGASTRSRKRRPDYERMLKDAAAGRFEVICSYTSARLTRRPMENEDLIRLAERHGTQYAYVRSPEWDLATARGREYARNAAARDAGYSEEIGELVSRARHQQAQQGRYGGGRRPYGFEPDGVTVRPAEARIVAEASAQVVRGASLRGLARDLRERKAPTVTGRPWSAETLKDILIRPRNAGQMVYKGVAIGQAPWAPLVPPDVFERVVAILTDSERRTGPGRAPRWLGSGIYRCYCGGALSVVIGGRTPRYRCENAHLSRTAQRVDELVEAFVIEYLTLKGQDLLVVPRPDVDVAGLRTERRAITENLEQLGADAVLGRITRAAAHKATEVGQARIAEIDSLLSAAAVDDGLSPWVNAVDPEAMWSEATLEERRALVRRLLVVTLLPAGPGPFKPETVRVEPRSATPKP